MYDYRLINVYVKCYEIIKKCRTSPLSMYQGDVSTSLPQYFGASLSTCQKAGTCERSRRADTNLLFYLYCVGYHISH